MKTGFFVPLCVLFMALGACGAGTTPTPATPTATPVPPLDGRGGGVLAFYSERDGNAEIYLMNADGTAQTRLTDNMAHDFSPAWSTDGAKIAFTSDRDDPNPVRCFPNCNENLYVMNADGTAQTRLTDTQALESHPDWSPDGDWISFDADRDGDGKGEIYIIHADGSGEKRLTDGKTDDHWADWSPDGTRIAFSSKRDGNLEIYAMNADGSNARRLTNNNQDDYMPDWSPDGTRIAFFSMSMGAGRQFISVMNADGTNLRQLTEPSSRVNEDPAWSPDGTRIAFQSDRDGNFEIYTMNADGTDVRRLTTQYGGDYWPAWRP
jgi:Tol biopolymer transport system component